MRLLQAAATVESGENASSSGCHLFMSFRLEHFMCVQTNNNSTAITKRDGSNQRVPSPLKLIGLDDCDQQYKLQDTSHMNSHL